MNRNTATKYVPAVNVVNGHQHQSELKLKIPHFNVPSISTHTLCLNGNGLGTMNSLSSNASTNGGSGSGGSSGGSIGGGRGGGGGGGPLENLPKKFVSSMRTLFDIMDDKRSGFVKLSDIEARWQDDGSKGLPHGVIDCLRRVTPISGMLSFERFCAGLKICLLRNQTTNDCAAVATVAAATTTMGSIGSIGTAAKVMLRRSSIDSLNSGNSSNSSNNHKMNSINHINNMNGNSHITSSITVNKSAAAAAATNSNHTQHIKNIHLHMMNNGNDHISNHNNSSINSDENNNDNNNSNHNSSNRLSINGNGSGRKATDDDEAEGDDEDSNVNCITASTNIIINKTLEKKLICSSSSSSTTTITNGNRHCNKNLKCNKNDNHSGKNYHGPTTINGDTNKTAAAHHYSRSSLPVQRTLSLPKLSPSSDGDSFSDPYIMASMPPSTYAPPKPPRTGLLATNGGGGSANLPDHKDHHKAEIRNALQNWQMNVLMNEWEAKDKRRAMAIPNVPFITRGTADGSSTNAMVYQQPLIQQQQQQQHQQQQQQQQSSLLQTATSVTAVTATNTTAPTNSKIMQPIYPTNRSPTLLEFQKKSHRRREIRRHTLQNGIDYNMLKRIRHYEEEKDLLLDGLQAVEKAQEWYFRQIASIQEKMKRLSRGDGQLEQWSEANKERLDLQRARIMEVNRHLASLEESWDRGGFQMHMNLGVRNHYNSSSCNGLNNSINGNATIIAAPPPPPLQLPQFVDVQINQLKVQNRQLTDEVSQKSERITDLEMERKSLYRDLLQYQQQQQQLQQQLLQKQGHILCANEEVIF